MSKKFITVYLILVCVFSVISFAACNSEKDDNAEVGTTSAEQAEITSAPSENSSESSEKNDIIAEANVSETVNGTASAQTESTSTSDLTENTSAIEKKGTLYRAECNSKIWAGNSRTIANVNDAMNYIVEHENVVSIRKTSLYTAGEYVGKVYLIALRGSDFTWNKEDLNRTQNCLKSGFSLNTDYLEAVKKEAIGKIPEGSCVALIGHSLGGMIAQQFAADKEMKNRYNIINTLTMGSPFIITEKREGDLHRMADSGDAVPYLSPVLVANAFLGNYTYECCGYFGNPGGAHFDSYLYAEEWEEYDCFGVKNGTSELVYR